ncbi:hypothetical protein CSUB01_02615 [Colletotrichum sublineola]|uniref:DUF7730 domain-containing protein n=1 Tax=Colletotrichum sublineola TaxID=1173701 RepID=A0A066X9S1_COLSU|nr:hypothetical protein CSUB01_02615 [Colletotrichum sublineola]
MATNGIPQSLKPATAGLHTPPSENSFSNSNKSTSQSYSLQKNTITTDQQAAAPASLPSGPPGFGTELYANRLIVSDSHEGEETRRDYNSDEDEVNSDDGDAVSEDGLGPRSGVRTGSDEPSNNDEDNAEVEDNAEKENEGSEPYDDDDGFDLSQSPTINLDRIGCSSQCRRDFLQGVDFYRRQVEVLGERLRTLSITNDELRAKVNDTTRQIDVLKNSATKKRTETTWHKELHLFITDPDHSDALSYSDIYKLCCKEENMSSRLENVHPNLRLRQPKPSELQAGALDGSDSEPGGENQRPAVAERDGPEALFVQDDEQTEFVQPQETSILSNLPFELFPANIQANIFKWVFIQEDKLIHCISRLDPYIPPEEPTGTDANRSGLPHRFHLSGKSCSVTYAIKPNEHLALFSVCKRWHYLGVHAFYGLNTFAFSSMGEFGRFCTGIGAARRERIQHVELLWMGNQYLTHKPVKEGNKLKWTSKRTWDVSWLCQMPRLKSLVIHVNESGMDGIRRGHEPAKYIDWMSSVTAGQPNFRQTRSLRTLQGLDFIYQLRGMELIQFYDYEMARKNGRRHPIRDWSFYMDVENVTAMPKTADRAQMAEFENLTPVLRDFVLPEEYLKAIRDLYRNSDAFDAMHISPAIDQEDEDEDGNAEKLDIVHPVERRNTTESRAANGVDQAEGEVGDVEMLDSLGPAEGHSAAAFWASTDVKQDEDKDSDAEMQDIARPAERRNAKEPPAVTDSYGGRRTAATRKLPAASEVRYDNTEDGSGSEDGDSTPKASVLNARSGSTFSSTSTIEENGIGSSYGDEVSVAGSSQENPIDLDHFEPEKTSRLTQLQHEWHVKREPSAAVSIGQVSSRESERSFDSGSGLFVANSSTMSRARAKRESTEMTETLRKRGFDALDIRNAIDLTETKGDPSSTSTRYLNSSQIGSTHQTPGLTQVAFNPKAQLSMHTPFHTHHDSEDEEMPFVKRPRRQ